MAKNYVQEGERLRITLAAAAVSGTPTVVGTGLLGIPLTTGAIGEVVEHAIEGVFNLPKASAAVITIGQKVLWDVSAGNVDDDAATPATGDFFCGYAWESKGNGTTAIAVRINKAGPTVT